MVSRWVRSMETWNEDSWRMFHLHVVILMLLAAAVCIGAMF